jgi:dsDNA-specific endonuclease/ATPase MutS2
VGLLLLLLDELGTGTDPVEGAALGQALLKQLIKGTKCLKDLCCVGCCVD